MKRKNNDRRRLRCRGRLMPAWRVVSVRILVVFDGHCPLQVDDRQQHEDECLQSAGDQPEKHHRQRYEERMSVNRMRITISSPKMLPKRRSDNDITRAQWLTISIG